VTFDLEAARALHDRDPQEPGNCLSCRYDNTPGYTGWPCPTATALGATGHTEWTGPSDGTRVALDFGHSAPTLMYYGTRPIEFDAKDTPNPDTLSDTLLNAMDASLAGTGTLHIPKIIEFDPPTYTTCGARHIDDNDPAEWPCVLLVSHDGPHTDKDGDRWGDDPDTRTTCPRCYTRCNHCDGCDCMPCIHRNQDTGVGPNTPLCTNPAATPTPDDTTHPNHWNRCTQRRSTEGRRCILDTNHINGHHYHDPNSPGGRCTAHRLGPGRGLTTCALDTNHATPHHVTANGINWGTNPDGPDAPNSAKRITRVREDGTPTTHRNWYKAGDCDNTNCDGPHGHPGPCGIHNAPNHTPWPNDSNPCGAPVNQRRCVFYNRHTGDHHYTTIATYTPCDKEHPGSYRCTLDTGHNGIHRSLNGGTL
jgi:hypothetical protein